MASKLTPTSSARLPRSSASAQNYAFSRSAENNQKGYIYIIAPKERKRAGVCDPAGWSEPKKTPPEQTGPGEDDGKEKGKGKGGIKGQKITESKFLQFLAELDPEFIRPLVEAVQSGEITVSDIQLAFKRALSETMEKR
ncbi:hypothetical protein MHUMG1_07079 [Metarhizium humberi]|uniref:Uncharacterized protein n=1 Tax=Metarhizium humberi TaxID=2596975 RepID=A0A9P8M7P6_9HYPO|nr:hypothetical protein MHUMG1_07079 [Metarhizium humberi]